MCAERRQCHRTYIMCPVSSITRAEISMQRTFRSLVPVYIYIYSRDLCSCHNRGGWKWQLQNKKNVGRCSLERRYARCIYSLYYCLVGHVQSERKPDSFTSNPSPFL